MRRPPLASYVGALPSALACAVAVLIAAAPARADNILLTSCVSNYCESDDDCTRFGSTLTVPPGDTTCNLATNRCAGSYIGPTLHSVLRNLDPSHTVTVQSHVAGTESTLTTANYDRIYLDGTGNTRRECDLAFWAALESYVLSGGDLMIAVEFAAGFHHDGYARFQELLNDVTEFSDITLVGRGCNVGDTSAGCAYETSEWVEGSPATCPAPVTPRVNVAAAGHLEGATRDNWAIRRIFSEQALAMFFDERTALPGAGRTFIFMDSSVGLTSEVVDNIEAFFTDATGVGTGVCEPCGSASDCPAGEECTAAACVAGICEFAAAAEGESCDGGVCDGATPTSTCVACLDTSATGTDSGCTDEIAHCDGAGTPDAACQPCLDTAAGDGIDLGCDARAALCRVAAAGGLNECVPCVDDSADGVDTGCTEAAAHCEDAGTAGASCHPCLDTVASGPDLGCEMSGLPVCIVLEGVPNACVECATDGDCSGATPFCELATNTCQGCVEDATCDDDDPCTADACSSAGSCTSEALARGTVCPDGVCTGGSDTTCVRCIDSSDDGIDDGCDESARFCVADGADGFDCVACIDCDAAVPMPDAGPAPEPDAGDVRGAVAGGALCSAAPNRGTPVPWCILAALSALAACIRRRR